jgi:hypothetical protein
MHGIGRTAPHKDRIIERGGTDDQRVLLDIQDLHMGRANVGWATGGPARPLPGYNRSANPGTIDKREHCRVLAPVDLDLLNLLRGPLTGCTDAAKGSVLS